MKYVDSIFFYNVKLDNDRKTDKDIQRNPSFT